MMAKIIIGHAVSGGFGTSLAPAQYEVTRGLGIVPNTTSDNLNPQGTTNHEIGQMGRDGAGLSCPGSSLVAETTDGDDATNHH
jgi:hypothetical protein